jgi:hypothetical protein
MSAFHLKSQKKESELGGLLKEDDRHENWIRGQRPTDQNHAEHKRTFSPAEFNRILISLAGTR